MAWVILLKDPVIYRFATARDCPLLGELNHQLIRDEGHRNRMGAAELEERMRKWFEGEYQGVIFEDEDGVVGYALFRSDSTEVYLRQFFIVRHLRRRGYGREAIKILQEQIWLPQRRLVVDVLVGNKDATAFWRSVGFSDYALTLEKSPKD